MPDALSPRPFSRTFAILGWLCLGALGVVALGAVIGVSAPGILAFNTAALLAGGALITLAVMVPLAFFALHRYAKEARKDLEATTSEAHTELHGAHDALLQENRRIRRLNEAMHQADRGQMESLSQRIQDVVLDMQHFAPAREMEALRASVDARHDRIENAQEAQWVGHTHSHREAEKAAAKLQEETEQAIAGLDRRIGTLAKEQGLLASDLQGFTKQTDDALAKEHQAIHQLRQSIQLNHKEMENKLSRWEAPENQLRGWADRVHGYTDHELARFRHKIQKQLNQFEARELQDVDAATRHTREEAALLAEDIVRERVKQMDETMTKRMAEYKAELDEQFAAFLAGQQAQRIETEARLAAVGATRGVKVESNEAYTLTSHAPFGQVYPIADVEGIGNKTAYTLQRMGILDTEHLWHADTHELSQKLEVTVRQIRQWQSQSELMAIDGIGPQWGEVLAASGVLSIAHLANLHGRELLELIQAHGHAYRSKLHKGVIGLPKAEDFIQRAREHKPERVVHV